MAKDPSPQVRRDIALSLRDIPADNTADIFVKLAKLCDTADKNSLEAIGLGAAKQESQIWKAIKEGLKPGEAAQWPDSFVRLTWRLWAAASIDDLKARCVNPALPLEKRKFAVESLGFIDDARAANVMLELATTGSQLKGDATAWLLRNLSGEWAKYDIGKALKEKGIYNPETITVTASPVPAPPEDAKLPPLADFSNSKAMSHVAKLRPRAASCVTRSTATEQTTARA